MYALSKGSSKLLGKTRRGYTQKVDSLESPRDIHCASKRYGDINGPTDMSSPKPVFQQVNGRRSHIQKSNQENITPQHEEITRYIHDTWKLVSREYEVAKQPGAGGKVPGVVYYQDHSSTSQLPTKARSQKL
ncbi:MAPK regulated corepressor interacting protein 2-like [Tachypleus tridentatus]|uniref:MAPK regulated corepressor interacting protein 2-like n=1 Tax=Tachypleus tridentatus TaxID=6853 RepID=UPI003FD23BC7